MYFVSTTSHGCEHREYILECMADYNAAKYIVCVRVAIIVDETVRCCIGNVDYIIYDYCIIYLIMFSSN